MIDNFLFLIPFLLIVFLSVFFIKNKNISRIKTLYKFNPDGKFSKTYKLIKKRYELTFLKYSKLKFEGILKIKSLIFIGVLTIILLIKATNIAYLTHEIFNKYDYTHDLFYRFQERIDVEKAFEEEKHFLQIALKEISKNEFLQASKGDIQYQIEVIINRENKQNELPFDTMANKIYYRLHNYYMQRQLNIQLYLIGTILLTFITELYFFIVNKFKNYKAKEELRIIKRLIILYGSIKPVNFMEVLEAIIKRSVFHKKFLNEVKGANKKTDINMKNVYSKYISLEKDLNTRLFYEKLDEANNYNFDKAIKNIKNEFKLERRERQRNVKKREELIHTVGVSGFLIIIATSLLYLLMAWIQAYNINKI